MALTENPKTQSNKLRNPSTVKDLREALGSALDTIKHTVDRCKLHDISHEELSGQLIRLGLILRKSRKS